MSFDLQCRVTMTWLRNLYFADPPKPNVTARYQGVVVHRDKNLTCTAKGKSISSVQWYKSARPLSMQQQEVRRQYDIEEGEIWSNTLLLENVTKKQVGWYECRAFLTSQKFGFWSAHVNLSVLGRRYHYFLQFYLKSNVH